MCDTIRLERWSQAALLEQVLERCAGQPERRELTAAFEAGADERERRIASWRHSILLQMMGARPDKAETAVTEGLDRSQHTAPCVLPPPAPLCRTVNDGAGNLGHVPLATLGSFLPSARVLHACFEYDRRMLEYRTA